MGSVVAVENQTVVTHPWRGAYHNRWLPVLRRHGVPFLPLTVRQGEAQSSCGTRYCEGARHV